MAYDEQTATRFREALGEMDGLSEKRMMGGFFFVEADDCDDERLGRWIDLALDFVKTLPAK